MKPLTTAHRSLSVTLQKSKVIYAVRDRKSVYSLGYGGNVWRGGAPSCVACQPNHHLRSKLRSDKGRCVPVPVMSVQRAQQSRGEN